MQYGVNLLAHIRAVNAALQKFNGRAELDVETLYLELKARGRRVELQPQFLFVHEGAIAFTPQLRPNIFDFIGWRGYFNRVWPLAADKLEFKKYCEANRLRTPRYWMNAADVGKSVLMKRNSSSFAQGITSPLTAGMVRFAQHKLNNGEFFEEFIRGTIAKMWYWNSTSVCLEMLPMASVTGDGEKTLRQLIDRIRYPNAPGHWQMWEAVAKFQGTSLESVIPKDESILVDFRYLSNANRVELKNVNVIGEHAGTPLLKQFTDAGEIFWRGIPDNIRENTVFSIDAIVDAQQQVWFLEMNCNPIVHPDLYAPMFESFFGVAAETRREIALPGGVEGTRSAAQVG